MTIMAALRVLCVVLVTAAPALAVEGPDFVKDVAPIFTKYCTGCHNDTDRDFVMSADEARDYGIIDEVISARGLTHDGPIAAVKG